MQFFKFSDYVLNLAQVSDIDCDLVRDSWTVYMASGEEYTLEEDNLAAFKAATGL